MHRIEHPARPDCMEPHFLKAQGIDSWDQLRDAESGKFYKEIKMVLVENQHHMCAYCESRLSESRKDIRIEHFHPKSDKNTTHNWGLDWNNLLAICCKNAIDDCRCDVMKQMVQDGEVKVGNVPAGSAIEGYILNPYEMPMANLFSYSQASGELAADEEACTHTNVHGNKLESVAELVESTIAVLNLNCGRLCRIRKCVANEFENLRKKLRAQKAGKSIRDTIAERWFGNGEPLTYFTTRRCLLKGRAEKYIRKESHENAVSNVGGDA